MNDHAGHELLVATGRRRSGQIVGWLACVDCMAIVGPVPVCGETTLSGRPCRTLIRADLGYTSCWSHGDGRGRTNTPRRRAS
jgi:hypothetical protein